MEISYSTHVLNVSIQWIVGLNDNINILDCFCGVVGWILCKRAHFNENSIDWQFSSHTKSHNLHSHCMKYFQPVSQCHPIENTTWCVVRHGGLVMSNRAENWSAPPKVKLVAVLCSDEADGQENDRQAQPQQSYTLLSWENLKSIASSWWIQALESCLWISMHPMPGFQTWSKYWVLVDVHHIHKL